MSRRLLSCPLGTLTLIFYTTSNRNCGSGHMALKLLAEEDRAGSLMVDVGCFSGPTEARVERHLAAMSNMGTPLPPIWVFRDFFLLETKRTCRILAQNVQTSSEIPTLELF